jgi:hypothetical protein
LDGAQAGYLRDDIVVRPHRNLHDRARNDPIPSGDPIADPAQHAGGGKQPSGDVARRRRRLARLAVHVGSASQRSLGKP